MPASTTSAHLDSSSYANNQYLCGRPLSKPCTADTSAGENETDIIFILWISAVQGLDKGRSQRYWLPA